VKRSDGLLRVACLPACLCLPACCVSRLRPATLKSCAPGIRFYFLILAWFPENKGFFCVFLTVGTVFCIFMCRFRHLGGSGK
jgi:hypothetical protein